MTGDVKQPSETAQADAWIGPLHLQAKANATPAGLLATGALVSGILLSAAVLVAAARKTSRRDSG